MKVIQPNCRVQFTADDVDFISQVLGGAEKQNECLIALLTDPDSRDQILDDESLFRAILEHRSCLRISNHLYFYVLVRNVLRKTGLRDRPVADYVAELLCEFSNLEKSRCVLPGQALSLDYFFEMMAALQNADERNTFYIRAHIGNQSLFLSGVFPDRIRARSERRGFPDLSYYQELGRSNFRAAGDHRLAQAYELTPIFRTLSEHFEPARLALNDLAERIFFLGDSTTSIESLLLNGKN